MAIAAISQQQRRRPVSGVRLAITAGLFSLHSIPAVHSFAPPSPRIRGPSRVSLPSSVQSVGAPTEVDDVLPSRPPAHANHNMTQHGSKSILSDAAQWHKDRRRRMLQKYGDQIAPLERDASSHTLALSLLLLSNASLFSLAAFSGTLPPARVALLAVFPGSIFSLWTLQILHDLLHGSLLRKRRATFLGIKRKAWQEHLLFWGSMPSAFGYYLYLKYGHLTHHKSLGDAQAASLKQLFESDQKEFEDGDVLFVAHRMKLKGEVGPRFAIGGKEVTVSISKTGFDAWRDGHPVRNAFAFAASFMYERFMLVVNDVVVAATGRNYFFPNKPQQFHDECAKYCRCAVAVRGVLWATAGWKSLLFLYLSEVLWSLPPHPACAMFVTNHGSRQDAAGGCAPSASTYAGRWYSLLTLGTNYHCEHHDFPTIPLHRLGELRKIAPEFYPQGSGDDVFGIMRKAFAKPEFYACMDANLQ